MYNNKKILLISILLTCCILQTSAQSSAKTKLKPKHNYAFVLYAGMGPSYYVSPINTQPIGLQTDIKRSSLYKTIRVMWHPNYRLRVGLETGYTNFYSYTLINGGKEGKVQLTSIPVLIMLSIKITKRVNLFAGFGSYFLTTNLNYNGAVKSHASSLGSNIAVNYVQPITKKIGVAFEGKLVNAFQTKDNMFTAQMHLVWRFLEY